VVSKVASWDLGKGESAVLSWAVRNTGWTVVIDDLAGRRCGRALGRPVTGTLGLLLLAKEEGQISEVKPVVDALLDAGLQVSDALLEEVLRKAGERR
jgi:predicted nucleic acid-binding protein